MDIQTFWAWLTGQASAGSTSLLSRGHLPTADPEGGESGVVLQVGDSSCVVFFQRLNVQVEIPKQQLTNPRPGQRVRVVPDAVGQQIQTNRTPTLNPRPLAVPQGAGIPTVHGFQGPQKFEYLWQPTLNRMDLSKPHFSSQQVANGYGEQAPRHSEPLDDLGFRHAHNLSSNSPTAWLQINHQTRKAFQPNYSTGSFSTWNWLPSVNTRYQLITLTGGVEAYIDAPLGTGTVAGYTSGYPQTYSPTAPPRDSTAYIHLVQNTEIPSSTEITITQQGMELDYLTGVESHISNSKSRTSGTWHEATLYCQSEKVVVVDNIPEWTIYRSQPSLLRIAMRYAPQYDYTTETFVMQPDRARWQGYTEETSKWWTVDFPVYVDFFGAEGLGNLSPGGANYNPAEWSGPIPTCNPLTGDHDPDAVERYLEFPNLFYVHVPTGGIPLEPDPPVDGTPKVTAPNLGGVFTVRLLDGFYGYGERFEPNPSGTQVLVNSNPLEGEWSHWAALRHKQMGGDTQTLLLCNPSGITVLLNLGPPTEFTWPEFWRALGQPENLQFVTATSLFGHHSYPLEDAYIGATLNGQDYVLVLSHLNPWRDLSKQQWVGQGLKRPKTWEAYLAYTAAGKPLPVTETGLVVTGVIPMTILEATRPAYEGGEEPLGFQSIPLRMLPISKGAVTTIGPSSVEILDWVGPPEAKALAEARALQVLSRTTFPEDKPFIGPGLYRLTFPAIPVTGISVMQFLGRGKGKLEALQTASGVPLQSNWTGYGLRPKTQGRPTPVSGWHPFSAVHPDTCNPSEELTITLRVGSGLQLSQLLWTVTALQ